MNQPTQGWTGYFRMNTRDMRKQNQQEPASYQKQLRRDADSSTEIDKARFTTLHPLGPLDQEQFDIVVLPENYCEQSPIGKLIHYTLVHFFRYYIPSHSPPSAKHLSINSTTLSRRSGSGRLLLWTVSLVSMILHIALGPSFCLDVTLAAVRFCYIFLLLNFFESCTVILIEHISYKILQACRREGEKIRTARNKISGGEYPPRMDDCSDNARQLRPRVQTGAFSLSFNRAPRSHQDPPPSLGTDQDRNSDDLFDSWAKHSNGSPRIAYDCIIRGAQRLARHKPIIMSFLFFSIFPSTTASCTLTNGLRIASGVASVGTGVAVMPLRAAEGIPKAVWISNYAAWGLCYLGYLWLQALLIPPSLSHRRKIYIFAVSLASIHFTIAMSQGFGGIEDGFALYGPLVATIFAYLMSLVFDTDNSRVENEMPIEMDPINTSVRGLGCLAGIGNRRILLEITKSAHYEQVRDMACTYVSPLCDTASGWTSLSFTLWENFLVCSFRKGAGSTHRLAVRD